VAVRSRALTPIGALIVALAAAGCSSAEGASSGTDAVSTPSIVVPRTQPVLKPATDCSASKEPLPAASDADGVRLDLSTDPSHSSLLLKNTGSLTVVVMPDAELTTRLIAAPYANPTDEASRAALVAVNNSGGLDSSPELPAYVPGRQIVILPPLWAVCALTDNVSETASVRYLRHKTSSAEYFIAKGLADQLLSRFRPTKARAVLTTCVVATRELLKGSPDLPDVELYAQILGSDTLCRSAYKGLLGGNEQATQQTATTVLNGLERAPRLLANTQLFEAFAGA